MSIKPVIVRKHELRAVAGISANTATRKERAGTFPKRRKLNDGTVGWLYSEIEEWAAGLPVSDLGLRGERRDEPEAA